MAMIKIAYAKLNKNVKKRLAGWVTLGFSLKIYVASKILKLLCSRFVHG